ncbi:MAG: helix-turn-helix domain-containing protein [Lachnospiraceae bacterium]|nr:helix-turn-helix domain-containing protein [Lachnospiraceae bacterium]
MQTIDFPITFLAQKHLKAKVSSVSQSFEIIYVLSGAVQISCGFARALYYEQGDLTMIRSGVNYDLVPKQACIILHIGITPAFIEQTACPEHRIMCDSVLEPDRDYYPIRRILASVSGEYLDYTRDHTLSITGRLFQLLDILSQDFRINPARTEIDSSGKYDSRIRQIEEYIGSHYQNPVSLPDLSEYLHLTPHYVSKFFRKNFGSSFSGYLNHVRMEHAVRDIRYTDRSITDIAFNSGFINVSTFNRNFRAEYGMSPKQYREDLRRQKQNAPAEEPVNPEEFSALSNLISRRSITVSAHEESEFIQDFCRVINIGFARNMLSSFFQETLLSARKDLNFTYVRMEGLVSASLIPKLLDSSEYDFRNVQYILNYLYENQLVPFVELSGNSVHTMEMLTGDDSESHPSRFTQRELMLLDSFLEYICSRFNPTWMKKWIFEFYKPAGLSSEQYVSDYLAIREVLRRHLPDCRFGGPGCNSGVSSDDLLDVLSGMHDSGTDPDFISVHFFAMQYESGESSQRRNLSSVERPLIKQQNWVIEQISRIFGREIPLYITEFNSCMIPDTYINTSCYQATFICHNLLRLCESSQMVGYWMLNDIAFSIANMTNRPQAGVSLLDKSGIPLPAYHAYRFLTKLGSVLIRRGEHYCITKSEPGCYQILAYYYVRPADLHRLQHSEKISMTDMYSYFEDSPPIDFRFTLTDLEPGVYRIHRYLMNRSHGSLHDLLLSGLTASNLEEERYLRRIHLLRPTMEEYLSKTCRPLENTTYIETENNLELEVHLSVHNICLWVITLES